MTRCQEEPDRFVLRIRWTSTADHLDGFRAAPDFREFFTHVRPFVDDIEEMQHYTPVLAG